jgi:hypothetical protein
VRALWLCVLVGCGRVGFERTSDGQAGTTGASVLASAAVWLPMDAAPVGGSTVDVAGNHTVSCTTCPTLVSGRNEGGHEFTGGTEMMFRIPYSADLDPSRAFTVAGWLRLASYPGASSGYSCVISKPFGGGAFDTYALCVQDTEHVLFYTANPGVDDYTLGPTMPLAEWHHLAMTWDGSRKRGFYDGNRVAEQLVPIGVDSSPLIVGADLNSGSPRTTSSA